MKKWMDCNTCRHIAANDNPCATCGRFKNYERAYTLSDLEQAREQAAEDERARCIEAVEKKYHHICPISKEHTWRNVGIAGSVEAIRALGPIGETREETERRVMRETVEKVRRRGDAWKDVEGPYQYDISAAVLDAIAEGKLC